MKKNVLFRAVSMALLVVIAMVMCAVSVSAANTKTLTISVKTSNALMAGTNAEIHVKFVDVNGKETENFNLESLIGKDEDAFERGNTDVAEIQMPADFGTIKTVTFTSKLLIANDTISSKFSDWLMESFTIEFDGNTYIADNSEWCDINEKLEFSFEY